ncbi:MULTISPECIES: hypothetical protein [unclassified Acinetobacter]|uniref:hypothetical protein n=1 Tax=unclassified Acinetobacter TaxID=196816 RepID=UPI0015D19C28|nr:MULTISPECIES: hypothetical protein [unclassified Acinetobacter]UUS56987.1 hypothetical protein MST16_13090 [Acinetobacter sp. YH16040_T]
MAKNLPLLDRFFDIFEEHEIIDWKANRFWQHMESEFLDNTNKVKGQMYRYLKIFVQKGFLVAKPSKINKRIYLYSASENLISMQKKHKEDRLNHVFEENIIDIKENLKNIEIELDFINKLILQHSEISEKLEEYKNKILIDFKKYEIQLKTIENFVRFCF